MSIETVSQSVEAEADACATGESRETRDGDDITNASVWRTFWWNHSNKLINAGLKSPSSYQMFALFFYSLGKGRRQK